jgi:hypothetical protein
MATFEEPDSYQPRGRERAGEKWQMDEKGRKYRTIMGGTVREYENRQDRDAALDESYRPSPTVQALVGEHQSVGEAILGNLVALGELYWTEAGEWGGDTSNRLDRWSARHFGRRLEPACRMALSYEIRRRLSREDGGHGGPPAGPFRDFAEQKRYEKAAREVGDHGGSFERVERIAKATGAKIGPGPRRFPHAPNTERRANQLRQQAAESILSDPGASRGHSGEPPEPKSAALSNSPQAVVESERLEELRRQAEEIVKGA